MSEIAVGAWAALCGGFVGFFGCYVWLTTKERLALIRAAQSAAAQSAADVKARSVPFGADGDKQ